MTFLEGPSSKDISLWLSARHVTLSVRHCLNGCQCTVFFSPCYLRIQRGVLGCCCTPSEYGFLENKYSTQYAFFSRLRIFLNKISTKKNRVVTFGILFNAFIVRTKKKILPLEWNIQNTRS